MNLGLLKQMEPEDIAIAIMLESQWVAVWVDIKYK